MVRRYPHSLILEGSGGGAYQDDDGNWVVTDPTTEQEMECRAEPNVRSEYTTNERDGSRIDFSYTVHLTKEAPIIREGSQIEVRNGQEVVYKGTVKRFHQEQMKSRLWV